MAPLSRLPTPPSRPTWACRGGSDSTKYHRLLPPSADRDEDPVMAAGAIRGRIGGLIRLDVAGAVDRTDLQAMPAGRGGPG